MPFSVDIFLVAGLFPPASPAQALRATVAYAQAAERAGFDGVWLAEHHFITYGVCPSAVTLAGYVLGRTRTIAVGTAAAILSNRHPVALAEEAALLDAVSGGRFRLGVARGGPWVDLDVFGGGLDRYECGFPEALELLLDALDPDGAAVAGDGKFFQFPAVRVLPRPTSRLPVWVAATSSSTVEEAARRGLPVLLGVQDDDEAKARLLRAHARTSGRTSLPHASAHLAYVGDSRADAEDQVREPLRRWLTTTREYRRIDGRPPVHRDVDAYADRLLRTHAVGSPAECADRLAEAVRVTGASRLVLLVEAAGCPRRTVANIRRLGREVLPALRAA